MDTLENFFYKISRLYESSNADIKFGIVHEKDGFSVVKDTFTVEVWSGKCIYNIIVGVPGAKNHIVGVHNAKKKYTT